MIDFLNERRPSDPVAGAGVKTRASFVVENGRPVFE
jgi:hypothetical protein